MKHRLIFHLAAFVICSLPITAGAATVAPTLGTRMQGRILLQVESHGEAWYVRSKDLKRYYMKDGTAAYSIMRLFSQGITDADLAKISQVSNTADMKASSSVCTSNMLANRLRGLILLQVQQHGEAWYVDPVKCRAIYMKDGAVAYEVMRFLGLGILTSDLKNIEDGGTVAGSDSSATTHPVAEQPAEIPVTPPPAAVTIDSSSACTVKTNVYWGMGQSTLCKNNWHYASSYVITISGSMTGPVGTVFHIDATNISSIDGETFSCGDWEKDSLFHDCKRPANSNIETAYWSLTRKKVAGEIVNTSPNLSPRISVVVKDGNRKVLADVTSSIACPQMDYCVGL